MYCIPNTPTEGCNSEEVLTFILSIIKLDYQQGNSKFDWLVNGVWDWDFVL